MGSNWLEIGLTELCSSWDNIFFRNVIFFEQIWNPRHAPQQFIMGNLKNGVDYPKNGFLISSSTVASRKTQFYPLKSIFMAKKINFVPNLWWKMWNFYPFLTGQPSHPSQVKFGLTLELDFKIPWILKFLHTLVDPLPWKSGV